MRRNLLFLIISLITLTSYSQAKYEDNWESLQNYKAPEWYEDAKIGFWVHWGVYSVPAYKGTHAAEWYGRWMYAQVGQSNGLGDSTFIHHEKKYGNPGKFGYKDFIPMFKAEKFNADEWADLFVKGGAKFFTMMGSHHDSFCMWNSDYTPWNAKNMGPKRDLVGEISKAVRQHGLKFGVSNHLGWNYMFFLWNHVNHYDADEAPMLYGNPKISLRLDTVRWLGEKRSEWLKRFATYVKPSESDLVKWKSLTTELCDKYKPDLYYFDWGFNIPEYSSLRKGFASHYYNKAVEWGKGKYGNPNVVLNYKGRETFREGTAVLDHERGGSGAIQPMVWQTDDCIYGGNTWGYSYGEKIKSVNTIVDQLMDIISKRGVLMLSLAPKSDGTFPDDQKAFIYKLGEWLHKNGEAVYSTRPWSVSGDVAVSTDGSKKVRVRFTRSKDMKALYATMLDWPDGDFYIQKINSASLNGKKIKSITLVSNPKKKVDWSLDSKGLKINMGKISDEEYAFPLKITLK